MCLDCAVQNVFQQIIQYSHAFVDHPLEMSIVKSQAKKYIRTPVEHSTLDWQ